MPTANKEDDDDEEDDDGEEDDEEDGGGDTDKKCCDINIKTNIMCDFDSPNTSDDFTKDKYDYNERYNELYKHDTCDLKELCDCYDIKYNKRSKDTILIKKILNFEFWNLKEIEDIYEGEDCDSSWIVEGDEELGYFGEKYNKGREETKKLYCGFYEKHGFQENSALNIKKKCFSIDPLPAMEINMGENKLADLINVFFSRKHYKQGSEFCGVIDDDKILLK